MSDPRRWKDSPDAPIGMRELLSAARPARGMDERSFRRGAARVAKLGAAPAAAAAAVGIWTKLAAAGVVGLAAVGTVVAVRGGDPARPIAPPEKPVAVVASAPPPAPMPAPTPAPLRVEIAPEPAPPAPLRAHATATATATPMPKAPTVVVPDPAPAPAARQDTLAAELALLEDARAVLARDPDLALVRLEAHRRRHPNGELAVERDLMELDALRRAGRTEDAEARARAWLARDPNGMHAARVRAILEASRP